MHNVLLCMLRIYPAKGNTEKQLEEGGACQHISRPNNSLCNPPLGKGRTRVKVGEERGKEVIRANPAVIQTWRFIKTCRFS